MLAFVFAVTVVAERVLATLLIVSWADPSRGLRPAQQCSHRGHFRGGPGGRG